MGLTFAHSVAEFGTCDYRREREKITQMFLSNRMVVLTMILTTGVVRGLQWSDQLNYDKEQLPIQVCSGQNLQLFWNFTLDDGELLKGMVWGCLPEGKAEHVLATYVDDHFVPVSSFSGRLSHLKDSGIELSCATILESGNYSIAVTTEKEKITTVHHKTASVTVVDPPKTLTGDFHVTQAPEVVRDVTTGSFHVLLLCGNFSDRGHPPVDVMWTTPTGEKLPSSSFKEGYFQVQIPNPVVEGKYTCSLTALGQPACSCLPGDSPLRQPDTLEILEMSSRFLLLEAQQREILDRVKAVDDQRVKDSEELSNRTEELSNRTEELEKWRDDSNEILQPITFHARLTEDLIINAWVEETTKLILGKVITNEGNGYNSATGVFQAPLSGTYFFVGTTGPNRRYNTNSNVLMKMNGKTLAETKVNMHDSYHSMGSCQAIVHLKAGESVWLESNDEGNSYATSVTSFSGFRIG